jgi:DNA-binding transcriptional LysR family regulator
MQYFIPLCAALPFLPSRPSIPAMNITTLKHFIVLVSLVSLVSLGLGVGVAPQIVLDNSPHAARVRILEVTPALATYDLGLFTLKRDLKNPLVSAFLSLLHEAAPSSD